MVGELVVRSNSEDLDTPPTDGRFIDKAAEARSRIEALLPSNILDYVIQNGVFATEVRKPSYDEVSQDIYRNVEPIDRTRLEALKPGSLVMIKCAFPGKQIGGQWENDARVVFVGVVEEYDPEAKILKSYLPQGKVVLRRGLMLVDSINEFHSMSSYNSRDSRVIEVGDKSPFAIFDGALPAHGIEELTIFDIGDDYEGYDERALYDLMNERAEAVVINGGRYNERKLNCYSSHPDLLKRAEIVGQAALEKWIAGQLQGNAKDTITKSAELLRQQIAALQEELINITSEKYEKEYIRDLRYTQRILDSLKHRNERITSRNAESKEKTDSVKGLLTEYGFDLGSVNPILFPYFQKAIQLIAESREYGSEELKQAELARISGILDISSDLVTEIFPIPRYDIDHITVAQAVFTQSLDSLLAIVPINKRAGLSRSLRILYSRFVHPDKSPLGIYDKKLSEEMFKVGWPLYEQLERKYEVNKQTPQD